MSSEFLFFLSNQRNGHRFQLCIQLFGVCSQAFQISVYFRQDGCARAIDVKQRLSYPKNKMDFLIRDFFHHRWIRVERRWLYLEATGVAFERHHDHYLQSSLQYGTTRETKYWSAIAIVLHDHGNFLWGQCILRCCVQYGNVKIVLLNQSIN